MGGFANKSLEGSDLPTVIDSATGILERTGDLGVSVLTFERFPAFAVRDSTISASTRTNGSAAGEDLGTEVAVDVFLPLGVLLALG